jgi:hypothetical protein
VKGRAKNGSPFRFDNPVTDLYTGGNLKIPLTIEEDYVQDWGLFEGVREFMQNGRDATRDGCTFDVVYLSDSNTIRARTVGAKLEHRSLLLGASTKRGRSDMLGNKGEGYKVGSLALVRLGKGVKIRTGTEVWVPAIEFSKKFGAKVLMFDIDNGRKDINEVVVEISGVDQDEWDSIRRRFLFVDDDGKRIVESPVGSAIIDGLGQIFVDGIEVCKLDKFHHGYNFRPQDVKLDRDRRLVDYFEAHKLTARIWEALYLSVGREHCDLVDRMLANNVPDIEYFRYEWCVGQNARKQVAERYKAKMGGPVIPVKTESEVREIEFYGRKGAVVEAESLRTILETEVGTIEQVKRDLAEEIKAEHTMVDLDPVESKNYLLAMEFVSKATKRSGFTLTKDVTIVEFRSPNTMGMRKSDKIYLSRNTLRSFEEAVKTLVEEVAHEVGGDGTHGHVERMHTIYANGIAMLLSEGSGAQG